MHPSLPPTIGLGQTPAENDAIFKRIVNVPFVPYFEEGENVFHARMENIRDVLLERNETNPIKEGEQDILFELDKKKYEDESEPITGICLNRSRKHITVLNIQDCVPNGNEMLISISEGEYVSKLKYWGIPKVDGNVWIVLKGPAVGKLGGNTPVTVNHDGTVEWKYGDNITKLPHECGSFVLTCNVNNIKTETSCLHEVSGSISCGADGVTNNETIDDSDDVPDLVPVLANNSDTLINEKYTYNAEDSRVTVAIDKWESYCKYFIASLGLKDEEHKIRVAGIHKQRGSGELEFSTRENICGTDHITRIQLTYNVGIEIITLTYVKTIKVA